MRRILWLLLGMCVLLVQVASAQDLTGVYGESILLSLNNDTPSVNVSFEGNAGDTIYIVTVDDFVSNDFQLLSPSGGLLAQSDSYPNGSIIQNIELGASGMYTVAVSRPQGSEDEGEVILLIDRLQVNTFNFDRGDLSFEDRLPDAGALREFRYDMDAGDAMTVYLYGVNSSFTIIAPSGEVIVYEGIYNDPNAPLVHYPETGTYKLVVQTIEPGGTDFGLYAVKRDVTPLNVNEPFNGTISGELPEVFSFEATAGKMWEITAQLPEFGEKFLGIYKFDNREYWETLIANDSGSGAGGQPRIRPFIAPEDGTYYIALFYQDWNDEFAEFDFTLNYNPSTLLSLAPGTPIVDVVNSETGDVQYGFMGQAGQLVRITLQKLSDEGGLGLNVYSVEDEVIVYMGRESRQATFDVALPLDGFYEFVIRNSSYDFFSTLEYSILIELPEK